MNIAATVMVAGLEKPTRASGGVRMPVSVKLTTMRIQVTSIATIRVTKRIRAATTIAARIAISIPVCLPPTPGGPEAGPQFLSRGGVSVHHGRGLPSQRQASRLNTTKDLRGTVQGSDEPQTWAGSIEVTSVANPLSRSRVTRIASSV